MIRCDSMEEAVIKAYENAVPAMVLLSPASASFDRYRNFEERGNHFKRIVGICNKWCLARHLSHIYWPFGQVNN